METPLREWRPSRVLVTGATGFLGAHVCAALAERGVPVRALVRRPGEAGYRGLEPAPVADLTDEAGLRRAVAGVGTVIHLAAHVHQPGAADASEYRRVNVDGTVALLDAAVAAGARDFVFISTVKAVGEGGDEVWTERSPPRPVDPYGRTKLDAEQVVRAVAERHGLHAPILRLPLVYGPGMKANALRLFDLVDSGMPLPLGAVRNRRSLLYVGNFVAAVVAVLEHEAGNDLFFATDGAPVRTPDLIRAIGRALGRPARLIPVPLSMMRAAAAAGDLAARLLPAFPLTSATLDRVAGSLAVDGTKLERQVGYRAPYSLDEALTATARWYRERVHP